MSRQPLLEGPGNTCLFRPGPEGTASPLQDTASSSLLFSSSFLGLGDSWVVCHSLTALGLLLVFPGLPGWWLAGHDLFIEGRGQLGQPASCGQGVWFVNSPENWRTSQVGKVSHMGPLQVVEYGWSA